MIRSILVVALLAAALAGAQEPPRAKPEWSGTAGLGAIVLTGNTSTTTLNALLSTQRETAGWILGAKASGVYGRTRPVDRSQPEQTVALAASGQLRGDRKLLPQLTVFALGGVDTDHVASVEARGYGEGGLGYIWLDRKQDGKEERRSSHILIPAPADAKPFEAMRTAVSIARSCPRSSSAATTSGDSSALMAFSPSSQIS